YFLFETLGSGPSRIVDAFITEFSAENNKMMVPLTVRIEDLKLSTIRTKLTLEVEPIDDTSGLQPRAFSGAFELMNGFATRFNPIEGLISHRVKEFLASRKTPALEPGVRLIQRKLGFTIMDGPAMGAISLTNADLTAYIRSKSEETLAKF